MSLFSLFIRFFKREWLLQLRQLRGLLNSTLFFFIFISIFPLSLPFDKSLLPILAPGLTWMAMLLSALLSADRLLQQDYEQGIMEQWILSENSLGLLLCAKVLAHWVMNSLPVILCGPWIALLLGLSNQEIVLLIISLLCGTPALLFLCTLAAAFGLSLQQKPAFMALIVLPLTLPLIIFGAGLVTVSMQGVAYLSYLALLLALSLLCISLLPWALAAVIRISHSA